MFTFFLKIRLKLEIDRTNDIYNLPDMVVLYVCSQNHPAGIQVQVHFMTPLLITFFLVHRAFFLFLTAFSKETSKILVFVESPTVLEAYKEAMKEKSGKIRICQVAYTGDE